VDSHLPFSIEELNKQKRETRYNTVFVHLLAVNLKKSFFVGGFWKRIFSFILWNIHR